MKRTIALLLSLLMLLTLAASAENMNDGSQKISEELITVTAAGAFDLDVDYEEILTWKEWQDRLGIKFEMMFYSSEDWPTQRSLMFASDELPDIFFNIAMTNADMAKFGTDGYFVNLAEYEDIMPNFFGKACVEYPGLRGACTSYDGAIYGTKYITTSTVNKIARTFINNKWLANVGKEMPTTIDELYDVLVAFKEQDANGNGDPTDEIPLGFYSSTTVRTLTTLLAAFGINSDTWTGSFIPQADADGKVFLADTTDAYKAFLTFMNKCYNEGLMDTEAFVLTDKEVMLNCQKDLYGFYGCGSAPFVMTTTSIDTDRDWSGVMGLTSEYNDAPFLGIPSGISENFQMAINAESEYVEELVRFVDYMFSDEGGLACFSGYEGVTFDYLPDPVLGIDVLTIRCPEGFASSDEFRQYKAVFNGPFLTYSGIPARNALWYDAPTDILLTEEVMNNWGWMAQLTYASRKEGLEHRDILPVECFGYTDEETTELTVLKTDLDLYLKQAMTNFITGTQSIENDWEAHLAKLDEIGLQRYLEIQQAAYDRFYA